MTSNDFRLNWIGRTLLAISAALNAYIGIRLPRWFMHPIMNRCWMMRAAGGWHRIQINERGEIIN